MRKNIKKKYLGKLSLANKNSYLFTKMEFKQSSKKAIL